MMDRAYGIVRTLTREGKRVYEAIYQPSYRHNARRLEPWCSDGRTEEEAMSLWIQETFINETKDYQFGSGPWIDSECETTGELFRQLSREYGRCVSKVYVGEGKPVGWVFEKRMEYEDAFRIQNKRERVYLRHVWVSVSLVDSNQPLKPVSPWEKS